MTMFSFELAEHSGSPLLRLTGRIDGMTSPEIEAAIKGLAMEGRRQIICDCRAVTHVSSAGLRVFLSAQQTLARAGGELILCALPDPILRVFEMSGFTRLFRVFDRADDVRAPEAPVAQAAAAVEERRIDDIILRLRTDGAMARGRAAQLGGITKLATCDYGEDDVAGVRPADWAFGLGIASAGERYEEFKGYFGEAVVINNALWYYPAVARPAVDFMTYQPGQRATPYQFLTGTGFNGGFRHTVSITCDGSFATLQRIASILAGISGARRTGVVFLAESRGLRAMHLKQIPLAANRPAEPCDLFSPALFHEWFNYPIDPADFHHVVAGAGLLETPDEGGDPVLHAHGCVLEKDLVNNDVEAFPAELARTLTQMRALKVQHLLGDSRLGRSVFGLIELED